MSEKDSVATALMGVSGIGEKLARKIITEFGGEENLLKAIQNFEVDRLTSVEGISQRKAVEIVNMFLGNPVPKFLRTERAFQIYQEIIERILSYANTEHARNRIMLLHPSCDAEYNEKHASMVMHAKEMIRKFPRDEISNLMSHIRRPENPRIVFNPSRAILVENRHDYAFIIDMGLNRYHPVILNPDPGELDEYELIIYVYSEGNLEIDGAFNTIMVRIDSEKFEIVPETILSYFKTNENIFRHALKIRKLLGKKTVLEEVIKIIDEVKNFKREHADIDEAVNDAKSWADSKLKQMISNVNLTGDEVLTLLNDGISGKLEKIFDEVIDEAREKIRLKTGIDFDPFLKSYPLKIDQREVERIKKLETYTRTVNEFEKNVEAAKRLNELKVLVEREIYDLMEFDYRFALGSFALECGLNKANLAYDLVLKGAIHLNLVSGGENIQRVDYKISKPDNVVLLTGANSGGKTTLLETLAQATIMAHMGLPVCAEEATVKLVDEVYFISKKRSLDAGAFESFIKTFTPITTSDTSKLILLDELEAITELDAAVKIIATFIEFIKNTDSYAVIVTHMAREIIKYVDLRVDGIEAKGLDSNYNLIVDRTPRMNYLARSTPELIIRMIYERSDDELKGVYGRILEKFQTAERE